jgi:hypothetical protein
MKKIFELEDSTDLEEWEMLLFCERDCGEVTAEKQRSFEEFWKKTSKKSKDQMRIDEPLQKLQETF